MMHSVGKRVEKRRGVGILGKRANIEKASVNGNRFKHAPMRAIQ
jgi:hypothetical protein